MMQSEMFALAICLLSAVGCCIGAPAETESLLKQLCTNDSQLQLRRSAQVMALARVLDAPQLPFECPDQTVQAVKDLNKLLEENRDNVCSLEATGRIRNYHDTHLARPAKEDRLGGQQKTLGRDALPLALKNFFVGYGLQVSGLCKRNMISTLMYESEHTLNKNDHELIEPWTNEGSMISQLISDPNDYDDILLPRDIGQILMETHTAGQPPMADHDDDGKIFMQTQTGHVIRRMKAICTRRFEPIYEQLILPLLYLSNMGFNYKGEELALELQEMSLNKELHRWYRVVYLCESVKGLELVEDPEDAERTKGMDKRLVRILSAEEAAAIKEKCLLTGSHHNEEDELLRELPQIVYEMPTGLRLEDEILDAHNSDLMRMVHSFDTHKTEVERVRSKLLRKLAGFVVNRLKHGQLKVAFGAIFEGLLGRGSERETHADNSNKQVIEALDKYVDGIYNPDKPVAGSSLNKLGKRYYQKVATLGAEDYKNMGQAAKNKVTIKKGFWIFLALSLFIAGLSVLCIG